MKTVGGEDVVVATIDAQNADAVAAGQTATVFFMGGGQGGMPQGAPSGMPVPQGGASGMPVPEGAPSGMPVPQGQRHARTAGQRHADASGRPGWLPGRLRPG